LEVPAIVDVGIMMFNFSVEKRRKGAGAQYWNVPHAVAWGKPLGSAQPRPATLMAKMLLKGRLSSRMQLGISVVCTNPRLWMCTRNESSCTTSTNLHNRRHRFIASALPEKAAQIDARKEGLFPSRLCV
jgi:hypothetical protein